MLLSLLLFLALLLPRLYGLDEYVTIDEHKWLARSANFYRAVRSGAPAETYRAEHPGVTTMWAGTAGFLLRYPGYAGAAEEWITHHELQSFLENEAHTALSLLTAGRFFAVLVNSAVLSLAFFFGVRVLGAGPALVGFLFLSFHPFHVAHTQLLQLDGLASSFIALSLLAYLDYGQRAHWGSLLLSGVAFGLGTLTRLPSALLAPAIAGLTLAGELAYARRDPGYPWRARLLRVGQILFLWALAGVAVFVLAWPAMWVAPLDTVTRIVGETFGYAGRGHPSPVFFDGAIVTARNLERLRLFYPLSYLWRASPLVLAGLVLALPLLRKRPGDERERRLRSALFMLLLFTLLFTLLVNLSAKKADRYLLPVFPALSLVAAAGWVHLARALTRRPVASILAPLLLSLAIGAQLLLFLQVAPHPLAYYNPLLGGGARAPRVMQIGWGEGLAQAAHYLNRQPGAADLTVLSWYEPSFSYYFEGETIRIPTRGAVSAETLAAADYAVIYVHQWQRRLPEELLAHLAGRTPIHVVELNEIDYVQIYSLP